MLRKQKLKIPFVMLFNDPQNVHASWLSEKRAALTLAPTAETYQQALAAGTWYACSYGYSAYTAVTMKGTY